MRVGKIKKAPARNKARHTYLLTGKLFCGHCGSAMNADGNSQGYLYYRCYGKKNLDKQCNKRNMEKNLIERLVAQDAMSFLTDEYIEKIATICYGKKNLDKQCNKRNMEKNLIERLVAQDAMSFLTDEYIEKIATIACDRNKQEIESDSPIKRNMEKNLIERLVAQDAMSFLTDEYIEKIATIACDRNKQEIESDSPIPVIRDRIRQVDVSAQDAMSFLTDEYIEKIATIACDRNKQEIESDSPIPVIRDRIRQVDVSLNNLLKAIETGSAPDMLVKRMGELETEKKDMEVQLKKEMAHQVYIDKEQVIFWLEKFREGDINDEEFCQTVIDLFVNSVTVWDEPDDKFRITIAYNLTSIPQKTYRLSKDGRLSDYASNTPLHH